MEEKKFFFDKNNCPRAEYQPPNEILGWYLEQDVQSSPATCDEMLSVCSDVLSGQKESWEGVGNAHSIVINREAVVIENEFDESSGPCEVSIEELQTALKLWKELITST